MRDGYPKQQTLSVNLTPLSQSPSLPRTSYPPAMPPVHAPTNVSRCVYGTMTFSPVH